MKKEYLKYYKANSGPWEGLNLVCVCTIQSDIHHRLTGRGVSVCSMQDEPDDKMGAFHARNHALHALKGREDVAISTKGAILNIIKTDCTFVYHSESRPVLTWQERRFFYGSKAFMNQMPIIKIGVSEGTITGTNIHNDTLTVPDPFHKRSRGRRIDDIRS